MRSNATCTCPTPPAETFTREFISDDPKYVVSVTGDYTADADDGLILVSTTDPAAPTVSTVTLPCSDDLDNGTPITVVALDGPVTVAGLNNTAQGGTGTVDLTAGQEGTFRAIGSGDPCTCGYFTACVCADASGGGGGLGALGGGAARKFPARRASR